MEIRNATVLQITEAARKAGVDIVHCHWNVTGKYIQCHLSAPKSDMYRRYCFTSTGMRRSVSRVRGTPALCWHGYWHFYKALFKFAPLAKTRSRLPNHQYAVYTTDTFLDVAPPTGCINMSSWAFPVHYHDGCKCDKTTWEAKEHKKENQVWKSQ
jgi:hypothetical protein